MTTITLSKNTNIHLIGAGGVGMSALGQSLLSMGFSVTGSDKENSIYLQNLEKLGGKVWIGSVPNNIPAQSVVFHSTAITPTDIEYQFAKNQGLLVYTRHILLSWITEQYYTIAISGTHGKTTTTAWIAHMIEEAGLKPTAIIGGKSLNFESNFILGNGQYNGKPILIIEADESDSSFLSIYSSIAVVTNIEMDHPDKHSSLETLTEQFNQFINSTLQRGGFFVPSKQLHSSFIDTFIGDEFLEIYNSISINETNHSILVNEYTFHISLLGVHNLYNAACVILVGLLLDLEISQIQKSLLSFKGVARRMEILYNQNFVTVMDDYAHHPTEILAVYNAILLKKYSAIYIVWEPHRLSRFCYFEKEFFNIFDQIIGWDKLILLPIYKSGDPENEFPQYKEILQKIASKALINLSDNEMDICDRLSKELNTIVNRYTQKQETVLIIFMGAGKCSLYAHDIIKVL